MDAINQEVCRLERCGLRKSHLLPYSCGMSRPFRPYPLPQTQHFDMRYQRFRLTRGCFSVCSYSETALRGRPPSTKPSTSLAGSQSYRFRQGLPTSVPRDIRRVHLRSIGAWSIHLPGSRPVAPSMSDRSAGMRRGECGRSTRHDNREGNVSARRTAPVLAATRPANSSASPWRARLPSTNPVFLPLESSPAA